MCAAVTHIEREMIAGMNAGKTVHELMRDITLPDNGRIGEFHGKTSWIVRAIWEENAGWFHYADGTTGLYGVPRTAVDADLAEFAGTAALVARAQSHVDAGRPLEAMHLVDIALAGEAGDPAALGVRKAALEYLAAGAGSNLSETMWLKAEIADADAQLVVA